MNNKRWTHCAVPICFTQELKNCNFLVEAQSNSCRKHWIPNVWLSNSVFSELFRLFESKGRSIGLSAKKSYFKYIFYLGHVILWERNNFRAIFSSLSSFVFILFNITLCHSRRPRSSCYNFITSQRFNRQSWLKCQV